MKCNETEQYIKLYIDDELTGASYVNFWRILKGARPAMRRWKLII